MVIESVLSAIGLQPGQNFGSAGHRRGIELEISQQDRRTKKYKSIRFLIHKNLSM